MKEKINQLTEKYLPNVVALREELHKIPEVGFQEFETAEVIKRELSKLGIPFKSEVAKTGVVALIKGKEEGKTVLLRADMDALPIEEESRCKYKSERKGFMHACGHDGHVAGLLGTAMVLNELKDEIKGNIKLIFQPAEEGPGGAEPMINEGVLENPKVDIAFGCHIWPGYPAGKVGIKDSYMMASSTCFDIIIKGKGGHGSLPEAAIDPIVIGAQIITNIQNISSRGISTLTPAVISCCSIKSPTETYNVIPDTLAIKGTIRTFDEKVLDSILSQMENIIKGITSSYGANYEFNAIKYYPSVKNDSETFRFSKDILIKTLGEENVIIMNEPLMGSEDFAYFGKKVPSNFFLIGVGENQDENETLLHHPKLFWNSENLRTSVKSLSNLAVTYLNE